MFIPLSFTSHFLNWDAGLRFLFSFMAIVPPAKSLSEATNQLSIKFGDTMFSLLKVSFGNAAEIIVGMAALPNDMPRLACDADGYQYAHLLQLESFAEKFTALVIPAAYASTMGAGLPRQDCGVLVVASIEETADHYHIPKEFIGVMLLPIVQISCFVVPLLVIVGYNCPFCISPPGQPPNHDGKTNYMEGLMLIILSLVIALARALASKLYSDKSAHIACDPTHEEQQEGKEGTFNEYYHFGRTASLGSG
ncbi:hypothetical protein K503DRAFT_856082 [Rhizopogon vinicolor AM-OR11-026]|uniref:Uncharacterized protein n=1 Tax=Rhizopogon vinicolor AM-OR11-026 TaxID=1314800 RepID=A0A1B7N3J0_9AGAM|nr:hypothetical protein K503DRAFT_856082 [Rhizopogon vinicolor AM-OR11-026]